MGFLDSDSDSSSSSSEEETKIAQRKATFTVPPVAAASKNNDGVQDLQDPSTNSSTTTPGTTRKRFQVDAKKVVVEFSLAETRRKQRRTEAPKSSLTDRTDGGRQMEGIDNDDDGDDGSNNTSSVVPTNIQQSGDEEVVSVESSGSELSKKIILDDSSDSESDGSSSDDSSSIAMVKKIVPSQIADSKTNAMSSLPVKKTPAKQSSLDDSSDESESETRDSSAVVIKSITPATKKTPPKKSFLDDNSESSSDDSSSVDSENYEKVESIAEPAVSSQPVASPESQSLSPPPPPENSQSDDDDDDDDDDADSDSDDSDSSSTVMVEHDHKQEDCIPSAIPPTNSIEQEKGGSISGESSDSKTSNSDGGPQKESNNLSPASPPSMSSDIESEDGSVSEEDSDVEISDSDDEETGTPPPPPFLKNNGKQSEGPNNDIGDSDEDDTERLIESDVPPLQPPPLPAGNNAVENNDEPSDGSNIDITDSDDEVSGIFVDIKPPPPLNTNADEGKGESNEGSDIDVGDSCDDVSGTLMKNSPAPPPPLTDNEEENHVEYNEGSNSDIGDSDDEVSETLMETTMPPLPPSKNTAEENNDESSEDSSIVISDSDDEVSGVFTTKTPPAPSPKNSAEEDFVESSEGSCSDIGDSNDKVYETLMKTTTSPLPPLGNTAEEDNDESREDSSIVISDSDESLTSTDKEGKDGLNSLCDMNVDFENEEDANVDQPESTSEPYRDASATAFKHEALSSDEECELNHVGIEVDRGKNSEPNVDSPSAALSLEAAPAAMNADGLINNSNDDKISDDIVSNADNDKLNNLSDNVDIVSEIVMSGSDKNNEIDVCRARATMVPSAAMVELAVANIVDDNTKIKTTTAMYNSDASFSEEELSEYEEEMTLTDEGMSGEDKSGMDFNNSAEWEVLTADRSGDLRRNNRNHDSNRTFENGPEISAVPSIDDDPVSSIGSSDETNEEIVWDSGHDVYSTQTVESFLAQHSGEEVKLVEGETAQIAAGAPKNNDDKEHSEEWADDSILSYASSESSHTSAEHGGYSSFIQGAVPLQVQKSLGDEKTDSDNQLEELSESGSVVDGSDDSSDTTTEDMLPPPPPPPPPSHLTYFSEASSQLSNSEVAVEDYIEEVEYLEYHEDEFVVVEGNANGAPGTVEHGVSEQGAAVRSMQEKDQDGTKDSDVTSSHMANPEVEKLEDFLNDLPDDLESAVLALIEVVYKDEEIDIESMLRRTPLKDLFKFLKQQYWYKLHTNPEEVEEAAASIENYMTAQQIKVDDVLKGRLNMMVATVQQNRPKRNLDEMEHLDESVKHEIRIQRLMSESNQRNLLKENRDGYSALSMVCNAEKTDKGDDRLMLPTGRDDVAQRSHVSKRYINTVNEHGRSAMEKRGATNSDEFMTLATVTKNGPQSIAASVQQSHSAKEAYMMRSDKTTAVPPVTQVEKSAGTEPPIEVPSIKAQEKSNTMESSSEEESTDSEQEETKDIHALLPAPTAPEAMKSLPVLTDEPSEPIWAAIQVASGKGADESVAEELSTNKKPTLATQKKSSMVNTSLTEEFSDSKLEEVGAVTSPPLAQQESHDAKKPVEFIGDDSTNSVSSNIDKNSSGATKPIALSNTETQKPRVLDPVELKLPVQDKPAIIDISSEDFSDSEHVETKLVHSLPQSLQEEPALETAEVQCTTKEEPSKSVSQVNSVVSIDKVGKPITLEKNSIEVSSASTDSRDSEKNETKCVSTHLLPHEGRTASETVEAQSMPRGKMHTFTDEPSLAVCESKFNQPIVAGARSIVMGNSPENESSKFEQKEITERLALCPVQLETVSSTKKSYLAGCGDNDVSALMSSNVSKASTQVTLSRLAESPTSQSQKISRPEPIGEDQVINEELLSPNQKKIAMIDSSSEGECSDAEQEETEDVTAQPIPPPSNPAIKIVEPKFIPPEIQSESVTKNSLVVSGDKVDEPAVEGTRPSRIGNSSNQKSSGLEQEEIKDASACFLAPPTEAAQEAVEVLPMPVEKPRKAANGSCSMFRSEVGDETVRSLLAESSSGSDSVSSNVSEDSPAVARKSAFTNKLTKSSVPEPESNEVQALQEQKVKKGPVLEERSSMIDSSSEEDSCDSEIEQTKKILSSIIAKEKLVAAKKKSFLDESSDDDNSDSVSSHDSEVSPPIRTPKSSALHTSDETKSRHPELAVGEPTVEEQPPVKTKRKSNAVDGSSDEEFSDLEQEVTNDVKCPSAKLDFEIVEVPSMTLVKPSGSISEARSLVSREKGVPVVLTKEPTMVEIVSEEESSESEEEEIKDAPVPPPADSALGTLDSQPIPLMDSSVSASEASSVVGNENIDKPFTVTKRHDSIDGPAAANEMSFLDDNGNNYVSDLVSSYVSEVRLSIPTSKSAVHPINEAKEVTSPKATAAKASKDCSDSEQQETNDVPTFVQNPQDEPALETVEAVPMPVEGLRESISNASAAMSNEGVDESATAKKKSILADASDDDGRDVVPSNASDASPPKLEPTSLEFPLGESDKVSTLAAKEEPAFVAQTKSSMLSSSSDEESIDDSALSKEEDTLSFVTNKLTDVISEVSGADSGKCQQTKSQALPHSSENGNILAILDILSSGKQPLHLCLELPAIFSSGSVEKMAEVANILAGNLSLKVVSVRIPSNFSSGESQSQVLSKIFEAIGLLRNLEELRIESLGGMDQSSISTCLITAALRPIAARYEAEKKDGFALLSIQNVNLIDNAIDLIDFTEVVGTINEIPSLRSAQVEVEFVSPEVAIL